MSIATGGLEERLAFGQPDRLEKALRVSGVTSIEMAAHLEVSPNTISNYINGRTKPSKSQLRDWAMKCGVPLDWIETGHVSDNGGGGDGGIPSPGGIGAQGSLRKITLWFPANENNVRHIDRHVRHTRWTPDREREAA